MNAQLEANIKAYEDDRDSGVFDLLSTIAWVKYRNGLWLGSADSRDELERMFPGAGYVAQPNAVLEQEIDMFAPLEVANLA